MLVLKPYDNMAIKVDGPCVIRFAHIGKARRQVRIEADRSVQIDRISVEQADAERVERIRMQQMEQAAAE